MALGDYKIQQGNTTYYLRRTKSRGCTGCLLDTQFKCPIIKFCSYISVDIKNYRCERIEQVTELEAS